MAIKALKLGIPVGPDRVSGLLMRPDDAKVLFLFAHGAGVGMMHPSMEANARGLAQRGIATLRYNFPYMEKGGRRPDPPHIAQAAVRNAAGAAAQFASDLPLFAGGRSYGGRMTSQAQAAAPLPNVKGLAFLGFPLHPAGQPGTDRAEHLEKVQIPMLFVSGDRDALADMSLLQPLVEGLGEKATLHVVKDADHVLRVPAKSGRGPADAINEALDTLAEWMKGLI